MAGPSGATARLALPYPLVADTVDVPRDVLALAAKLDALTALKPSVVSVLPGAPADGDECYYQNAAMATAGIVWHLRYRAAIADAYKWECLGGGPLQHEVFTSESVGTAGTWANLATQGPLVTVPLAGIYNATHGCAHTIGTRGLQAQSGVAIGDTTPASDGFVATLAPDSSAPYIAAMKSVTSGRKRLTCAAGDIVKMRYLATVSGGAESFERRTLDVLPMRVG